MSTNSIRPAGLFHFTTTVYAHDVAQLARVISGVSIFACCISVRKAVFRSRMLFVKCLCILILFGCGLAGSGSVYVRAWLKKRADFKAVEDPTIFINQAKDFMAHGNMKEAIDLYSKAICRASYGCLNSTNPGFLVAEPDNFMTVYKRALAYLNTGQVKHAIDDFQRVLELRPKFSQVFTFMRHLRSP